MALDVKQVREIIAQMYEAKALATILRAANVQQRAFYKTIAENPALELEYTRAQHFRAEIFADEILDIADVETDPQKARNRIDARKWYASKMQPQKFGDRVDINMQGSVDILGALSEGKRRAMLPSSYPGNIQDAEIVDTKQLPLSPPTDSESVAEGQAPENREDLVDDLPNPLD